MSLCIFFSVEQQIVQLDLSFSWAFGVKWSPSGNTLAYVGQKLHSSAPNFQNSPLFLLFFFSFSLIFWQLVFEGIHIHH